MAHTTEEDDSWPSQGTLLDEDDDDDDTDEHWSQASASHGSYSLLRLVHDDDACSPLISSLPLCLMRSITLVPNTLSIYLSIYLSMCVRTVQRFERIIIEPSQWGSSYAWRRCSCRTSRSPCSCQCCGPSCSRYVAHGSTILSRPRI